MELSRIFTFVGHIVVIAGWRGRLAGYKSNLLRLPISNIQFYFPTHDHFDPHQTSPHLHKLIMTRTERAGFPRALLRDRSESKSGLDKSVRKNGSGQHNWGSINDERYLEAAALADEEEEEFEEDATDQQHANDSVHKKPKLEKRANSFTEAERESARQIRKNVLKAQDIDLSMIARTSSAASTSPPTRSPPVFINGSAETASIRSA